MRTRTAKARWHYDLDPVTGQPHGASLGHPTLVTYSSSGPGGSVNGSHQYWYDDMGRVTRAEDCVDSNCQQMGYTYDAAGRLKYLHYPDPRDPDGENVKYTYDPAGQLTSVGSYLTGIDHDTSGRTTSQRYGNGLFEQRTYDPNRGWLDSQTLAKDPKFLHPLFSATYAHDPTGRVNFAMTSNPLPGGPPSVTETFGYDELGRLTAHTTSARPSVLPETYQYDALGRITRSPTAGTYHYDDPAHPHAVTSTAAGHSRSYDSAGNVSTISNPGRPALTLTWGPSGMPQTMSSSQGTSSMVYDETGQRVRRITATGSTYYLNQYVELNAAGMTRSYWAGDQLIARRGPTGKVSYLLQDRLHSTRVVTDDSGAVTGRYDYEPYGAQNPGNLADGTSQLWQGQRSDEDSGLIYMNARFYDPELGQFTAPDSLVPDVYQPQTLNRYAIDNNDPTNRVDPSGHMSMRVELKKEQEQHGLRLSAMYARALLGGCVAGGGAQGGHSGTACPSFGIPDFTVFGHRQCDPNCSKPVDKKSEKTTGTESVWSTTKVAAETVSNEAVLTDSTSDTREEEDRLLCEGCTLLSPDGEEPPSFWERLWQAFAAQPTDQEIQDYQAQAALKGLSWFHETFHVELEAMAAMPVLGLEIQAETRFVEFALAARELQEAEVVTETAMRLEYQVFNEADELLVQGFAYSSHGGKFGHAEMRLLKAFEGLLQPGDQLVLNGANAICQYGACRSALNAAAMEARVTILYYGYTPYPSLTLFEAGTGWFKAPRLR